MFFDAAAILAGSEKSSASDSMEKRFQAIALMVENEVVKLIELYNLGHLLSTWMDGGVAEALLLLLSNSSVSGTHRVSAT